MPVPSEPVFARLVFFIICLSVAGGILAFPPHYFAVDLPAQENLQAPENDCISPY